MPRPLVIIHGWSDDSASFRPLATLLENKLNRSSQTIDLADYISMDDEVTYDDLISTMMQAWQKINLPLSPFSVDVVVHSTGGLIIRDWISRNFTPTTSPIKNLVMLAPANFGSPLAHKGRAFFGRVIKGFDSDKLFQVGAKLLKGLELASPYTWNLGMRDRFGKDDFYGPNKILCTVLVGNTGFGGISAAANENGGDGVVRVSSANMNCAFLHANFADDPLRPIYSLKSSLGTTGFCVMDKENHDTIANKDAGFNNTYTLDFILRGLQVDDASFASWCNSLNQMTQQVMLHGVNSAATHGYQNTVTMLRDQFNNHVTDYFIEFFNGEDKHPLLEEIFHHDIITTSHAYTDDTSYRSLYIDCTLLNANVSQWQNMQISLTALPDFAQNKNVGYRTFTDKDIGAINLTQQEIMQVFVANRTLLVEILLQREQSARLFSLNNL